MPLWPGNKQIVISSFCLCSKKSSLRSQLTGGLFCSLPEDNAHTALSESVNIADLSTLAYVICSITTIRPCVLAVNMNAVLGIILTEKFGLCCTHATASLHSEVSV